MVICSMILPVADDVVAAAADDDVVAVVAVEADTFRFPADVVDETDADGAAATADKLVVAAAVAAADATAVVATAAAPKSRLGFINSANCNSRSTSTFTAPQSTTRTV